MDTQLLFVMREEVVEEEERAKNKDSVGRCECAVSTEQPDQLSLCVLTGIEAGGWRGRVGCLRASYYRHHSPPNWRAREQHGWSGIIFANTKLLMAGYSGGTFVFLPQQNIDT